MKRGAIEPTAESNSERASSAMRGSDMRMDSPSRPMARESQHVPLNRKQAARPSDAKTEVHGQPMNRNDSPASTRHTSSRAAIRSHEQQAQTGDMPMPPLRGSKRAESSSMRGTDMQMGRPARHGNDTQINPSRKRRSSARSDLDFAGSGEADQFSDHSHSAERSASPAMRGSDMRMGRPSRQDNDEQIKPTRRRRQTTKADPDFAASGESDQMSEQSGDVPFSRRSSFKDSAATSTSRSARSRKRVSAGGLLSKVQERFSSDDSNAEPQSDAPKRRSKSQRNQAASNARLRFADDEQPLGVNDALPADSEQKPRKQSKLKEQSEATVTTKLTESGARTSRKQQRKAKQIREGDPTKPAKKLQFEPDPDDELDDIDDIAADPKRSIKGMIGKGLYAAVDALSDDPNEDGDNNVGIQGAQWAERRAMNVYQGSKKAVRSLSKSSRRNEARKTTRGTRPSVKAALRIERSNLMTENPQLRSTFLTRVAQKQKLKRKYAAVAHQSTEATVVQQNIRAFTARASKAAASFIRKHPIAM